ncbi:DUF6304 family protein [Kitasatospora sp. NPDC051170]|uniref:DUF6304 family protein n=1 Tax=Kitasatospora sp. NPDC051170 TaxID=3364056 RepID=UPI0037915CCD
MVIPQSFPGEYADEHGAEPVTWRFEPLDGTRMLSFEIHATVRGVDVCGDNFDWLVPVDVPAAVEAGLSLDSLDSLTACVLTCDFLCTLEGPEGNRLVPIRFAVELSEGEALRSGAFVRLSMDLEGQTFSAEGEWFEDGLLRLAAVLPDGFRLRSCVTCLFSDYSPAGQSVMGIRCHRDDRAQYLAVRRKHDYWSVPVTEEVPETYLCGEFEPRVPGTGYRG